MPFIKLTNFEMETSSTDHSDLWLNTDCILSIWRGMTTEKRKDGKQEFTGIEMTSKTNNYVHESPEIVLQCIVAAGNKVVLP